MQCAIHARKTGRLEGNQVQDTCMTWSFYPKHRLPAGPELRYVSKGQKPVLLLAEMNPSYRYGCRYLFSVPIPRVPVAIFSGANQ